MNSYMEQLLIVNLSKGTVSKVKVSEEFKSKLIGGKGFGAKLLYNLLPPGIDALAPGNVLMFIPGPLTGTLAPATRGCVVTKSPLTGAFLDSYYGGVFSAEIKYAGYDGILILGRAPKPTYLWIDSDQVEIHDARHLWGQDTFTVNSSLKKELQDPSVKIACIGPAGENCVRFALISCEYNRQAGRGGAGAVMGSKNLKAIAIRGKYGIQVKEPEAFLQACEQAYADLKNEPLIEGFTVDGTVGSIPFAHEEDLLPTRNYSAGQFEKVKGLYPEAQRDAFWLRDTACLACPIRCSKVGQIKSGRYSGIISDIVEYENAAMMGSNLGLSNAGVIAYLVKKCDALGLDGMSAGGVIGFTIEAFQQGMIAQEMSQIPLDFGEAKKVDQLLSEIAFRATKLGNLLAEGVKRTAAEWGAEALACHVKGLETPAWGPRSVPGMALAYVTGDRGGCHQRAFPIIYEVGGVWKGEAVERLGTKFKAEIVSFQQNYLASLDTFVKCDFGQYGIKGETYRQLLKTATGMDLTEEEQLKLGERVWNLVRLFNWREGFTRTDDRLPVRFMEEPLPGGPYKGVVVNEADVQGMLDEYYAIRGWNAEGEPTEAKLRELGLLDLSPADFLRELG